MDERGAARLMRAEAESLKDVRIPDGAPDHLRVWLERRRGILDLARGAGDPARFLRWKPVVHGMFWPSVAGAPAQLAHLRRMDDWRSRRLSALRGPVPGDPEPPRPGAPAHGTLVRHAHELALLEGWLGGPVGERLGTVLEFGGGVGDVARQLRRLGFRGVHVVYDLPEVGVLQRYFLRRLGLPVLARPGAGEGDGVLCTSSLQDVAAALLGREGGLLLATLSISEAPLEVRERFMQLTRGLDVFFLEYQSRFKGVDNDAWFAGVRASRTDLEWHLRPIGYVRDNWLLRGKKKGTAR